MTIFSSLLLLGVIPVYLASSRGGRRHGLAAALLVGSTSVAVLAIPAQSVTAWRDLAFALGLFAVVATVIIVGNEAARAHLDRVAGMVITDALTGCLNRRGFDEALVREAARSARSGRDLALLALDIDHFKLVNDSRGHPTGDLVLCQLGALLARAAREGDRVARTGGEEFSIILPDTSVIGALCFATRLCEQVRQHAFGDAAATVTITVSVGVASAHESRGGPNRLPDVLQENADEALYAAKRAGRDRAQAWTRQPAEQLDLGVGA